MAISRRPDRALSVYVDDWACKSVNPGLATLACGTC